MAISSLTTPTPSRWRYCLLPQRLWPPHHPETARYSFTQCVLLSQFFDLSNKSTIHMSNTPLILPKSESNNPRLLMKPYKANPPSNHRAYLLPLAPHTRLQPQLTGPPSHTLSTLSLAFSLIAYEYAPISETQTPLFHRDSRIRPEPPQTPPPPPSSQSTHPFPSPFRVQGLKPHHLSITIPDISAEPRNPLSRPQGSKAT